MMIMKSWPLLFLLCLPMAVAAELHIDDPWIKEAPPGTRVMAGYLQLENRGTEPQALTSVTSPAFDRIELHRSVIEDDVVRMQSQATVTVSPGDSVTFEPGGYHLMMYDPRDRLTAGEQVELLFGFANGRELRITAEVRRDTGDNGHRDHHHHHHH